MIRHFVATLFAGTMLLNGQWYDAVNELSARANHATLVTENKTLGLVLDNLAVDSAITWWGYKHWEWGSSHLHMANEKWFEYDSPTGGSDKSGHFYMTYMLSRVLSSRMEDRGLDLKSASLYGSLSALFSMTLLEVGDGSSEKYGFSKKDLIADTLGALTAYWIRSHPRVDDFLDVRMEYAPTSGYLTNGDSTTDYSGMRHLVAFQLSGFKSLKKSPLRFLELQTGFYSRGYRPYDTMPRSQHVYFGIGFSLHEGAKKLKVNPLKNLFEFYQPGHTYIEGDIWHR